MPIPCLKQVGNAALSVPEIAIPAFRKYQKGEPFDRLALCVFS